MLEFFAPFTIGLIGSLHCLGMCGPLILAYSFRYKTASGVPGGVGTGLAGAFVHHLAFHAGRVLTYGILGALVAALFESLEVHRFSMQYRGSFLVLAGILLFALGLVILRIFPLPSLAVRFLSPPSSLGNKMGRLASSGSVSSRIGLGLTAGLLPCGLTWAMLITAASTLNPAKGMLTMISFGLGTMPLLLLTGVSASFLSIKTRLLGERTAGVFVILMGLLLVVKGAWILGGWGDSCCVMN